MNAESLIRSASSVIFWIACLGILLGLAEWVAQLATASLIGDSYSPGRILELAALLFVFVITVTLRDILGEIRRQR